MGTTVSEMTEKIERIDALRSEKDSLSKQLSNLNELIDESEIQMIDMLEKEKLTNFRSSVGLVSIVTKLSIQTPKSPEDRQAFFSHLRDMGLFENMITVHSATLNSYVNKQFELAKEAGKEDFKIPGISEIKPRKTLSFRKSE